MALIACAACGNTVSETAKICMNCGHPVRKSGGLSVRWVIVSVFLSILALLVFKVYPDELSTFTRAFVGLNDPTEKAPSPEINHEDFSAYRVERSKLRPALVNFVGEWSRATPYRVNNLVTLTAVRLDESPLTLEFIYEMNGAASGYDFDFDSVGDAMMNRYCTSPDLAIASTNDVPVRWRYVRLGRTLHEKLITTCLDPN